MNDLVDFIQKNVTEIRVGKNFTTVCVKAKVINGDHCVCIKGVDTFMEAIHAAKEYLQSLDFKQENLDLVVIQEDFSKVA